jgi:hypothetical protein
MLNEQDREPIYPKCEGCGNIITQKQMLEVTPVNLCRIYVWPEALWSRGNCVMATHIQKKTEPEKKTLDPIKASKKKAKGKL